jgi:hypothetical protein
LPSFLEKDNLENFGKIIIQKISWHISTWIFILGAFEEKNYHFLDWFKNHLVISWGGCN